MMRTTQLYQAMVNSSSICRRGLRNEVAAQVASLTRRRRAGSLEDQAVMRALLDTPEIKRVTIFVADHQAENLGVELAAARQIAHIAGQVAGAGDAKRRRP